MIPAHLESLIRQIEITTRKKISGPLLGGRHTRVTGLGLEFNQLREYIPGDDIRFIDWKSSARASKILVREFLEDRNRTIYLVVDVSASTSFGTVTNDLGTALTKADLMKELAAVLAFSSLHVQDSVGLILFGERVEKFIPPKKSRNHVLTLVKTVYSYIPQSEGTNLQAALEFVASIKGQKALVCLVSDFMAPLESSRFLALSRYHDFIALRCLDPREKSFPRVGTLAIQDRETHSQQLITDSEGFHDRLTSWNERQRELLSSARIDMLDCEVGLSFTGPLLQFLKYRMYR